MLVIHLLNFERGRLIISEYKKHERFLQNRMPDEDIRQMIIHGPKTMVLQIGEPLIDNRTEQRVIGTHKMD